MQLLARPFDPDSFSAVRAHMVAVYAKEKVEVGTWAEADAHTLSEAEMEQMLPRGLATTGHALRQVVTREDGATVGWFWVGPARPAVPGAAWLFDIEIVSAFRGHGLARQVMQLAETEALKLGYTRLGLHVFASNAVARHLYEACGFALTDLCYSKTLD